MKLLTALAICLSTVSSLFSQSHVIYIKPDGSKTANSDSANSYIIYQRDTVDSVWFMQQYDMGHIIMTSGYYADEAMSIPHGKFIYYQYYDARKLVNYDFDKRRYDTTNFDAGNIVSSTGYYVNGKRNGKWQIYNERGVLSELCFYRDDQLSGPFRYYAEDGKRILQEGFMKGGFKDGNWSFYSPKGALMGTIRYYKGEKQGINSKLDSKILSVKNGMPDYDLPAYITGALKRVKLKSYRNCSQIYAFHLNKDGKLTQPETIDSGCNMELNVAIGIILMDAPAWDPPIKNKQATDAAAVIFLRIRFDADKKPLVTYYTSYPNDNIFVLSSEY